MKKQFYAVAALATLSFTPSVAHAMDIGGMEVRPYAGVGLGAFGLEYKDTAVSQKQTVFGGFLREGADIGDYFGLELRIGTATSGSKSYAAGTLGAASGTLKTSADMFVSYLAKFQMPADEFKPYVMVGGTTAKFKATNSATNGASTLSKTALSYGVGLDYRMSDALSASVEWMQYWNNVKLGTGYAAAGNGGAATDSKAKIWGLVAAVDYHF